MKIGLFLPVYYEGGSFRIAKLYAKLLKHYADQSGQKLEIVFGNTEGKYDYDTDLNDLAEIGIEIRYLEMKKISSTEARYLTKFLNLPPEPFEKFKGDFIVPYDRGNGYLDCDFWFFMVDRIFGTVLPVRPFGIFATDFIQRYVPDIFDPLMYTQQDTLTTLYRNFRNADLAFACTPGTASDLVSYVGREKEIVVLDPLFDDSFIKNKHFGPRMPSGDYFVWVTNGTIHKNHERAIKALDRYYSKYNGKLKCVVTGVYTHFFNPDLDRNTYSQLHPYLRLINDKIAQNEVLKKNLLIKGNIPDSEYQEIVSKSRFLWHNVIADNGTFSVIEAARMGVRSLSSRYPQQESIESKFNLGMKFFDPFDVEDAAKGLHLMEANETPYVPPEDNLKKYSQHGASENIGSKLYNSILRSIKNVQRSDFVP